MVKWVLFLVMARMRLNLLLHFKSNFLLPIIIRATTYVEISPYFPQKSELI